MAGWLSRAFGHRLPDFKKHGSSGSSTTGFSGLLFGGGLLHGGLLLVAGFARDHAVRFHPSSCGTRTSFGPCGAASSLVFTGRLLNGGLPHGGAGELLLRKLVEAVSVAGSTLAPAGLRDLGQLFVVY